MTSVAVFTGSSPGNAPEYGTFARQFGRALAGADAQVVFGGGRVGLMGQVADGALEAGGTVVGVITHDLVEREIAHGGLTRLEIVDTLHERKARMAALSDLFVALPGGTGTLDEWFDVWSWGQLGLHRKPVALVGPNGFWDPLLALLDHQRDQGFLRPADRDAVIVAEDAAGLLDAHFRWRPPPRRP